MERLLIGGGLEVYRQRDGNCSLCPIQSIFKQLEIDIGERREIDAGSIIRMCKKAGLGLKTETYLLSANLQVAEGYWDKIEDCILVFDCNQDVRSDNSEEKRCGSVLIRTGNNPQNPNISRVADMIGNIWFKSHTQKAS